MKLSPLVLVSAFALCLGLSAPVHACQNFVGGVCLDKKRVPAKPKTQVRKKKPAQPVVAAPVEQAPAPSPAKTADNCVTVEVKTVGADSTFAHLSSLSGSLVILKNTCQTAVTSYLQLRNCISPAPFFGSNKTSRRRKVTLNAGGRKSLVVTRGVAHNSAADILRVNHTFKGQSGGYPPRC